MGPCCRFVADGHDVISCLKAGESVLTRLFVSLPTGNFKGMCKQIDHFPEDTDYEADPSEYFLREYRVCSAPLGNPAHSSVWTVWEPAWTDTGGVIHPTLQSERVCVCPAH